MKIFSAEYVLPISDEPVADGAVAFENDKIVAVGTRTDLCEKFPDATHENFGEAAILPGFVNAHSHLEITAMRNFLDAVEHDFAAWLLKLTKVRGEILDENDIEISALWGALEGVRAGVTCFADIGRNGKAGFSALKSAGLRGIVFQETEFSPTNETAGEDFDKLLEKFSALRETETGLVKAGISPHAPYTVSRKLFEKITDFAVRENVKISIHAAESIAEKDFLLTGKGFLADLYERLGLSWHAPQKSSVEYLSEIGVLRAKPLLAHCVNVSDADIEILKKSDSAIAHCPKSNAKFGHGISPLEKFLDRKIRVGFGSDSVASNNICDILEEAKFAAFAARSLPEKKRLLSAREILETATRGGAAALGAEREIGTLETGKQSDLIVISLQSAAQKPIHDIFAAVIFASNARDVVRTVVAGREIFRNEMVETLDEKVLSIEIKRVAGKIKQASENGLL